MAGDGDGRRVGPERHGAQGRLLRRSGECTRHANRRARHDGRCDGPSSGPVCWRDAFRLPIVAARLRGELRVTHVPTLHVLHTLRTAYLRYLPLQTLQHGFEASGIPTRFPHPSQLYRTLLAKDWQPQACLMPQLHVPPVTSVNRACIVADPMRAARSAIASLDEIRETRYDGAANEPPCLKPAEGEVRKGVVKLGFAWEAAHVRLFRGENQLALALHGRRRTRSPSVHNPFTIRTQPIHNPTQPVRNPPLARRAASIGR